MFSELIEIKSELNAKSQGRIESQNFPIPSKKYATKPIALTTAKTIIIFFDN